MSNFLRRVRDGIVNSATKILNNATRKAIPEITERISEESLEIWKSTSTYHSLTNPGGGLNTDANLFHQFGFTPADAINIVDGFLEEASKNVRVDFSEFRPGTKSIFGGGIKVFVLRESLGDSLSSAFSSFSTEKGQQIEWAKWLLTEGNKILISDFKFKGGSDLYSRSSSGIMIKASGGVFRVPPEHQGIRGDNFLTRSLNSSIQEISERYSIIIKSAIVRRL
jgi:hypothetical protein